MIIRACALRVELAVSATLSYSIEELGNGSSINNFFMRILVIGVFASVHDVSRPAVRVAVAKVDCVFGLLVMVGTIRPPSKF